MSTNRKPSLEEFEELCQRTCRLMNDKAQREPDYYLSKGAQRLEPEVKKAMDQAAQGTVFQGTIEIISGQRFPDIVVAKRYGVEVKSTREDKWTMIGGSEEILVETWNSKIPGNRMSKWIELVSDEAKNEGFNVAELLKDIFEE